MIPDFKKMQLGEIRTFFDLYAHQFLQLTKIEINIYLHQVHMIPGF